MTCSTSHSCCSLEARPTTGDRCGSWAPCFMVILPIFLQRAEGTEWKAAGEGLVLLIDSIAGARSLLHALTDQICFHISMASIQIAILSCILGSLSLSRSLYRFLSTYFSQHLLAPLSLSPPLSLLLARLLQSSYSKEA